MENISNRLLAYLRSWYATTIKNKANDGVEVNLTFSEFVSLFQKRQLVSLQKAIDANRIRYQQDEKNLYAYVATWKSYAACSTGIYDINTACICSRMKSAKINLAGPGDTLRKSHRKNISEAKSGVALSDKHIQAISEGKKGRKIAGWTEERKAARRKLRQAQEAAKRAEIEALELVMEEPEKTIEVATKIKLSEYEEVMEGIVDDLKQAGVYFELSAASVVRTCLAHKHNDWFAAQGRDWGNYFACGWQDAGGLILEVCCFDISSDIECTWSFPAEEKAIAMLFKLTFGGM